VSWAFFQAEDGIRDRSVSRGLGDVYKRQMAFAVGIVSCILSFSSQEVFVTCLLYTSDAADDTPCVDLGGRRIIKKPTTERV
ncbi:hypothetical protein, partial [Staphylococcus aureus]